MTYQDYLETWKDMFGDEPTGKREWWSIMGKLFSATFNKMTEEEFNQALAALEQANADFDEALKLDDEEGMAEALKAAYPHELALLV